MNIIKSTYCLVFAVVAVSTALTIEASAQQQAWDQGYSPSCSERGGCQHGKESLDLIPYGQSSRYGNGIAATRIPYRDSFHAPYQSSLDDHYSGGCGFGSTCGQSQADQRYLGSSNFGLARRCPYEQRQFEQASFDPRSTYDNQRSYSGGYQTNPGFNTQPSDATPSRRNLESYQQAPANRRPELRTSPAFLPNNSYGQNESRPQSEPPTSTQIMPPPELPPQPSKSNSRQSSPQLVPPTIVPSSQQSAHDHAGHDHAGHDHSGHNH